MKYNQLLIKTFLMAVIFFTAVKDTKAQPQISLTPTDPYNLTISSVINFQIIPDINPTNGEIEIIIKRKLEGDIVYQAKIPGIDISNAPLFINSRFNGYQTLYQNPKFILNDLIRFGRYQVCVLLILKSNGSEKIRECIEINSLPTNPPSLISPTDKSNINELNPMLMWIPPTPINPNWTMRYHLKLTEIQENQTSIEALKTNLPIYENANLSSLNLIYPIGAIPLVYEKNYAWSITAYDANFLVGQTEIWQFRPAKDSLEKVKESFRMMSFSLLEANPTSQSYSTGDYFCIQFNPCADKTIPLEIFQNTSQEKPISLITFDSLLDIGDGKFVVDLKNIKGLKTSERYTLMYSCDGVIYKLNFQYNR